MDPLSDVLSLLKPRSYSAGGFGVRGDLAIQWPKHPGIKCYALLSGQCWLNVEGVACPVQLTAGDCFILPCGLPFSLSTNPALRPVPYTQISNFWPSPGPAAYQAEGDCLLVGGHFALSGQAGILLRSLPPIVHIRQEADKVAMRWSLERMCEELRNQQPGSTLIVQQLAYMMLIQALRLHLADGAASIGWLSALADPQMAAAITAMHDNPGQPWTLQKLAECSGMSRSTFALRFKQTVGTTPMEYLTRWRMLLAGDRLKSSTEPISAIAASLCYDSESAFGKAFRRTMGCSPKQYNRWGLAADDA